MILQNAKHAQDGLALAISRLAFIFDNCDMIYPVCLTVIAVVGFLCIPKVRAVLRDKWAVGLFIAVPVSWLVLIPLSAAFLGAMDGDSVTPAWANGLKDAIFYVWPVLAAVFVVRMKGVRAWSAVFAVLNIPGWLLGSFVAAMALSGDWI